jgi:hypothetical protein
MHCGGFWSVHYVNFPAHDHFHCMFALCVMSWCHVDSIKRENVIFEIILK